MPKAEFFRMYVKQSKPVVIRGLVDNWAAFEKWNWDYFSQTFGHVEVGTFRLKNGECDTNIVAGSILREVPIDECMHSIAEGRLNDGIAVAAPVDSFPELLQNDFQAPVYCADGKFLRSRLFMGPKGTITSLHQDLPENLYVMVKGSKRITLFPPNSKVYPNSRLSKLPNHSKIDPEYPNYELFPKLESVQPFCVDLEAGETLFIPSFWWHHLRNIEPSIAVNFWWSAGWKLPIAWAAATYKKWRKI